MPPRRALLAWLAASGLPMPTRAEQAAPRTLVLPRDHGAHNEFGIEWWYATGWLQRDDAGNRHTGLRLSAHLLPLAHRRRAEHRQPLRGAPVAVRACGVE